MRSGREIDPAEIGVILITWSGLAVFTYHILDGYFFR
jgi:hypothetical protein